MYEVSIFLHFSLFRKLCIHGQVYNVASIILEARTLYARFNYNTHAGSMYRQNYAIKN